MTTFAPPMCLNCIHFQDENDEGQAVCTAFPDGIPDKIFFEAGNHKKPWPGDHGVRFAAKDPILEEEEEK